MDSINYVGKLKEYADKERVAVNYEDIGSDGPDHIRSFTIRAVVNGQAYPEGVGNNKKEAKKNAAKNAWLSLTRESADSKKTEDVADVSATEFKSVNYVSWLYDFGQKNKLFVKAVESLSVGTAFASQLCSFVVGDKEYPVASGKTKKEAKEEAAKLVYMEMFGSESVDTGLGKESFTSSEQKQPLDEAASDICDQMEILSIKTEDGSTQTNYIQTINLFCQQKKLLPTYVEESRSGPSHCPKFFYKLLLNKREFAVGEGRSVKEAKQKAAELAWSKIQEQSETSSFHSGRAELSTPTSTKDSGQVHSSSGSDWIEFKGSAQPSKSRVRTPDSRPKVRLAAKFERARSKEDLINFKDKSKEKPETEEAQTPLMNGRFTKEYDSIEGLGRGKFGFVYKAKRKLEEKDFAVKIVRYKEEALQEVKVLSDLNHCNIVRYYSCWIEESAPQWDGSTDSSSSAQSSSDSPLKYLYIQMELCETKTLRAWIDDKNKQDPKKSLRDLKRREEGLTIALQIVHGVEYIHSKKLIHRDLKPANILFDRNGGVKIGDFGLVTVEIEDDAENQKDRSGFKGTPSYMAPEQKRKTLYNYKVDIFALGLIYFELIWNLPTFHERNEIWTDLRHQHFPENFRSHFYEESQMIKSMLCVHPKDRPKASKLKADLEKWKRDLELHKTMERDSRTL